LPEAQSWLCENNSQTTQEKSKEMNFIASAKARTISRVSVVVGTGIIAGMLTLTATPASADSTWDGPKPVAAAALTSADDSTWDAPKPDSTWDGPTPAPSPVPTADSTWD
jgi:hypothetical protein